MTMIDLAGCYFGRRFLMQGVYVFTEVPFTHVYGRVRMFMLPLSFSLALPTILLRLSLLCSMGCGDETRDIDRSGIPTWLFFVCFFVRDSSEGTASNGGK